MRIGIVVDERDARVGAPGAFEIRAESGERVGVGLAGETWAVSVRSGSLALAGPNGVVRSGAGVLRIVADEGVVTIDDRPYRGELEVRARNDDRVTVVNVLDLEAYLRGVVPREIGARPEREIEAVKAQAVAARTYAVGNLGGRVRLGFDFFATTQDQVYGGVADEEAVASRAIAETRGVVATWQGQPILAYYSSTCGGRTANIEDAWPWRAPVPYLRSVSDADGSGGAYCDTSNRYRWTTEWTRSELLEVLGQTLRAHKGAPAPRRVERIEIAARSPSGTVSVELQVDGREYRLPADSTRWILRPRPGAGILNSARITTIDAETHGNEVHALRVNGMGWGHAVGMCQFGAIGRARSGSSYEDILRAYYNGIDLTTMY